MDQIAAPATATLTVKKRNGQLVPFFEIRIQRAIESAWKDQLALPLEVALPADAQTAADDVARHVVEWCRGQSAASPVLFIEDIQDGVIAQLRAAGHAAIAERYAAYRRLQELKRFDTDRLTIRKRDGRTVSFKPEKIAIAIGKAFAAQAPGQPLAPSMQAAVLDLADHVVAILKDGTPEARTVHIEDIQDLVERVLMEHGHHDVARGYILYREERHRLRGQPQPEPPTAEAAERITIRRGDGATERLDLERLKLSLAEVGSDSI
jgi:anaerobic ribonucleoside-triphosphate reductase